MVKIRTRWWTAVPEPVPKVVTNGSLVMSACGGPMTSARLDHSCSFNTRQLLLFPSPSYTHPGANKATPSPAMHVRNACNY